MKIRCKNCYRVLNPNEEYCTNCGEHSARMQQAMQSGNYELYNEEKIKVGLAVFGLAGFLVCGILQVIFAAIENKLNNGNGYTNLFCETNSIFYSSIFCLVIGLIVFRKNLKDYLQPITKSQLLGGLVIAGLGIAIVVIISHLSNFTILFPRYIVEYLKSENAVFFDITYQCIFKILVGYVLVGLCMEFLLRKYLVDFLDDTMLGDLAIGAITTIALTILETMWIMSLDTIIVSLIINAITTGTYMYTNRNIIAGVIVRVLSVIILIITFII